MHMQVQPRKGPEMDPEDSSGNPIVGTSRKRKHFVGTPEDGVVIVEHPPATRQCKSDDWKSESGNVQHKLACPFYKKDPQRFARGKACHGPGWTGIHRLKAHLKRWHAPAVHTCGRCQKSFKTDEILSHHLRADKQCPVQELNRADGIMSRDLALSVQSRTRYKSDMTDEEKWKELYRKLFPRDHDAIPSPCNLAIPSFICMKSTNQTQTTNLKRRHHLTRALTSWPSSKSSSPGLPPRKISRPSKPSLVVQWEYPTQCCARI
ncbi:hypothetical protein B0I35DRAFT_444656 [Stachybotrys elegans]|uniref:C2H2-type domain-containing protein n=1 Tax=Stachybotrys elegans TaxID=80388 RepID=A0A8K0SFJ8_9HYPO|nr:hypothetical protein B0I35DRAFT_444656 [Stachybotrys elegans]